MWMAAHPDYAKNRQRDYRAKYPERCRAYGRKYRAKIRAQKPIVARELKTNAPGYKKAKARREYLKHRAAYVQRVKNWRINNRERFLEVHTVQEARRRAARFAAKGNHTANQWLARIKFFGWRCWICKMKLTKRTVTQDHVIPLSNGGSNWASNLRPACHSCNASKNDKKGGVLSVLAQVRSKKT